jgi:hypothetical protein
MTQVPEWKEYLVSRDSADLGPPIFVLFDLSPGNTPSLVLLSHCITWFTHDFTYAGSRASKPSASMFTFRPGRTWWFQDAVTCQASFPGQPIPSSTETPECLLDIHEGPPSMAESNGWFQDAVTYQASSPEKTMDILVSRNWLHLPSRLVVALGFIHQR